MENSDTFSNCVLSVSLTLESITISAISLSRLFRFHIVANGSPGAIHDNTGHMGAQTSQVPSLLVVVGLREVAVAAG